MFDISSRALELLSSTEERALELACKVAGYVPTINFIIFSDLDNLANFPFDPGQTKSYY